MTLTAKDTLFKDNTDVEDFVFTDKVVEVFDDMLDRSVPFYQEVISSSAKLIETMLLPNDTIIDLGCATGTTLLELARQLPEKRFHFVGIDNSEAMLAKARLKAELYSKKDSITFLCQDIAEIERDNCGAFLLNYTLQFIRPIQRQTLIQRLYNNLRPGGILILSEKVINHDAMLNRRFIDIYHQFKRERGYSELEIARKREALENILVPFSIRENQELLTQAGFFPVETFFQWFNFVSFIGIKPQ